MKFVLKRVTGNTVRSFKALALLSLIFSILTLLNIINSDYFGDDLYNFQIPGLIQVEDRTMFDYIVETTKGWIASNGRIFPLGFYGYYIFDIFNGDIVGYKWFILSFIVLNVALFSYFVYVVSGSKFLTVSVLIATPLLFQYRYYHDAILAFHGLMQLLFLLTTVSLLTFVKYIQSRRLIYYLLSLLFFLLSLLTYEISYLFFLFYIPLVFLQPNFKKDIVASVKVLMPYMLILLLLAISTLYLRSNASLESGPYLFSWDLYGIAKTYFYQVMSVLPVTHFTYFGSVPKLEDVDVLVFIIGTLILIYVYFGLANVNSDKAQGLKSLVLLAVLIILIPGFLIAFSTKFQGSLGAMNMVKFGRPYIPIYIQTFGLSLLAALWLRGLMSANHKKKVTALIVILFIYLMHHVGNNQVIKQVNAPYKTDREVLTKFLSGDFKDRVRDGDIVHIPGEAPFHSRNFLSMLTDKKVDIWSSGKGDYTYKVQYESSHRLATINVHDSRLEKDFIIVYEWSGSWEEVYNEYKLDDTRDGKLLPPIFSNFYPWEGGVGKFRWATSNPSMLWINLGNSIQVEKLNFHIMSLDERNVIIQLNGHVVKTLTLKPEKMQIVDEDISLQPGKNNILFLTDKEAIDPPGADNRLLLFGLGEVHPLVSEER